MGCDGCGAGRRSIYLIGMPGCGKTTLGRMLANALRIPFVDLDERIERAAGMPIPRIFAQRGEAAFRALERAALGKVAVGMTTTMTTATAMAATTTAAIEGVDGSGIAAQVVATGGGIVLFPENVATMRAYGIVLWIDRPLEHILGTLRPGTRPLLEGDAQARLRALHAQRAALYQDAAHIRLDGADMLAETLHAALYALKKFGWDADFLKKIGMRASEMTLPDKPKSKNQQYRRKGVT